MQILALDTSSETGTCALWQDGLITGMACPAGRSHSETLIPLVQQLLAETGNSFASLDGIAFGMGPGAFTGLRVACGIAQGVAVALDIPVLPVGSLEAMAWASGEGKILSLLDARMGEVYAGGFSRQGQLLVPLTEIGLYTPAELPLPEERDWQMVGNALAAYPLLQERCAGWTCVPHVVPRAEAVAELGALMLARGEGLDPALAIPRYVRDKVARTTAERMADGGKA